MQKRNYSALGLATQLANVMAAGSINATATATGSSSQANSFAIVDDVTVFTTAASNSGARLPSTANTGDTFWIANGDGNTMLIYPPTGGKLNFGTANASASLATLKTAICTAINSTDYIIVTSA
jgi:hypothetical protein